MLTLSRRADQSIQIGPDITITVLRVSNGIVRLGIDAPKSVNIWRAELQRKTPAETPAPCSGEELRGTSPQSGGA